VLKLKIKKVRPYQKRKRCYSGLEKRLERNQTPRKLQRIRENNRNLIYAEPRGLRIEKIVNETEQSGMSNSS
jgi:hypothetical protein